MDIQIGTRKESPTVVKWTVYLRRVGLGVQSRPFQLCGYNWNLKLSIQRNGISEYWSIVLHRHDVETPPMFPIILYIRDNGKDFYLSTNMITYRDTNICTLDYSSFRERHPEILDCRTSLQFMFDFYLRIPDNETLIRGKETVQTSDRNTSQKYLDENSCLKHLSLDLCKLVEEGTDSDMQLKCGDISIGAHKLILGARSEVFRAMMQSDMVEGGKGIVEIIDMKPEILKIFIRYIYTGNLPEFAADTALAIYEAADKYQVEVLKKRMGHLLVKNLSPENVLAILVIADAHSDSDLKYELMSYISGEKIPSRKEDWLKFCNEHPKLANEVLNFMYEVFLCK